MDYSIDDWERMQREAERRVRASQRRNSKIANEVHIPEFLSSPSSEKGGGLKTGKGGGSKILDFLNFKNIEIDSDTSTILMLMLLLSKEEQDELLMMALLYIML